jgi:hypothetical protein
VFEGVADNAFLSCEEVFGPHEQGRAAIEFYTETVSVYVDPRRAAESRACASSGITSATR